MMSEILSILRDNKEAPPAVFQQVEDEAAFTAMQNRLADKWQRQNFVSRFYNIELITCIMFLTLNVSGLCLITRRIPHSLGILAWEIAYKL